MIPNCRTVGRRDAGPAPALYRLLADGALSRAALDACACPVAIVDAASAAHRVTHVNSAFAALFGHPESSACGRSLADLIFAGDETRAARLFDAPPGAWVRRTFRATHRNGELRIVEAALAPLRDADGGTRGWVVSFFDCSELAALREELAALRSRAA